MCQTGFASFAERKRAVLPAAHFGKVEQRVDQLGWWLASQLIASAICVLGSVRLHSVSVSASASASRIVLRLSRCCCHSSCTASPEIKLVEYLRTDLTIPAVHSTVKYEINMYCVDITFFIVCSRSAFIPKLQFLYSAHP